jgi:DNA-binding transcriptional MerR regulator
VAERAYLSIGEVLALLKEEFPDVTISKIRFLESQGLLDPERTASGYRKFYEPDVERLRWILLQQREHFLPLKVIKGRLAGEPDDDVVTEPPPVARADVSTPAAVGGGPGPGPAPAAPPEAPGPERAVPERAGDDSLLSVGPTGANLSFEELAAASGLPEDRLRELEKAGFITGRPVAGTTFYGEECLVVAKVAAGFARFGIEARHLRLYKNSTEREAALFEQIVTPLLKQRNPQARAQAVEALQDLSQLGERLRSSLLRQAVKAITGT